MTDGSNRSLEQVAVTELAQREQDDVIIDRRACIRSESGSHRGDGGSTIAIPPYPGGSRVEAMGTLAGFVVHHQLGVELLDREPLAASLGAYESGRWVHSSPLSAERGLLSRPLRDGATYEMDPSTRKCEPATLPRGLASRHVSHVESRGRPGRKVPD